MFKKVVFFGLLVFLFLAASCSSEPTSKPTQEQVNKIAEIISLAYKGTSREGTITKILYDGKTVTAYTEIYPDAEGISIIKNFRVGLYTNLKHLNEEGIRIDRVKVIDSEGNEWIYP